MITGRRHLELANVLFVCRRCLALVEAVIQAPAARPYIRASAVYDHWRDDPECYGHAIAIVVKPGG